LKTYASVAVAGNVLPCHANTVTKHNVRPLFDELRGKRGKIRLFGRTTISAITVGRNVENKNAFIFNKYHKYTIIVLIYKNNSPTYQQYFTVGFVLVRDLGRFVTGEIPDE